MYLPLLFFLQTTQTTSQNVPRHSLTLDTVLSIVGGGLVAAVLTIFFNAWWDTRKQKASEDWEFRRYRANLIHHGAFGLMEVFFAAKAELDYLVGTLDALLATLNQLSAQADAIVRQQGGPALTVAQLEQRKRDLLQPFQNFNSEQVRVRWNQYEQKAKELEAKAESYLNVLQPLVPQGLNAEMNQLFLALSEDFVWDLPHAKEKFQVYIDKTPEFQALQKRLAEQIEVQLGRK